MRFIQIIVLAMSALVCALLPARAEKRVALVTGNNSYANLPANEQLLNAVNDARAVGGALTGIGFEVMSGENLARAALVDKLGAFTRLLPAGDTAFFFPGQPPAKRTAMLVPSQWRDGVPLTADQERGLTRGETFRECENCPEMVEVPAGSFTTGSPAGEVGRFDDEGPQHAVAISQPFAVGKFLILRSAPASALMDGTAVTGRVSKDGYGLGGSTASRAQRLCSLPRC